MLECSPAEGGTAHRLGQDEAYFTVRETLAESSTAADGVIWREPNDFCRCGFAALGCTLLAHQSLVLLANFLPSDLARLLPTSTAEALPMIVFGWKIVIIKVSPVETATTRAVALEKAIFPTSTKRTLVVTAIFS